MANETKKSEAASEDVKDDLLSQAAAAAVAGQETEEEKSEISDEIKEVEEKIEQLEAKEDSDGLPVDQKERSRLGRTLAALHRRLDEFDQRDAERSDQLDRLIEQLQTREKPDEDDEDDDVPITKKQAREIARKEAERLDRAGKEAEQKLSKQYSKDYGMKWAELAKDLPDEDYAAIMKEAENMKYDPSDNGTFDAAMNFKECQIRYLKNQFKTNPLDGNKPQKGIGTVTKQKVPDREIALPKLDAATQSYLDYVNREDGAEKATNLHKSLAK